MTTSSRTAQRGGALRKAGWLTAAAMLAVSALAPTANAASVTPTPINSGNPTCASFNAGWTQFKLEGSSLANGVYTDGTLIVTISNFVASDSGTPGSFDWSSNIGVDAVFVKAGSDKHNLYVYVPESTGDTNLGPQAGTGNGISHISFCYDVETASTPPSEAPSTPPSEAPSTPPSTPPSEAPSTPPSTPPSEAPSTPPSEAPSTPPSEAPSATPTGSELPIESDQPSQQPSGSEAPIASEAPTGGVEGATGVPGVTPPPTDTLGSTQTPGNDGWRVALIGFATILVAALTFTQPRRSTRRR